MLAIPYQGNCSEPTDAATMRGEIRRFTLALCGFAMLAAQLFHIYLPWLIARPAMLAFLMLMLFGTPMLLFPLARSPITLAVLVAMAGWSPACGSAVKARLLHRGSVRSNRRPASGVCVRRRHLESRVDPTSLLDVGLKKIPLKARCAVSRCCFSPAVAAAACRCRGPAWWAAWPACRSARRADRCRWPWRWPAGS